jgi:amino acid transporter
VIGIGGFYVLTGWCIVIGVGFDADISSIARSDPGRFLVGQITHYMGAWAAGTLSVLVVTSAFAAVLALFNNAARYLYALARDGVLPRVLAKTHRRYGSPYVASGVLTVLLVVVFALSTVAGLDPLLNISTALVGVGSVGLMSLLATTSLGIPLYFARRRMWGFGCTIAPTVGGCLIAAATVLAVQNYSAFTGVTSAVVNDLPFGLIGVAMVGIVQAAWLRRSRPKIYLGIGSNRVE